MNPFSMFTEKDTRYSDAHWSMTRVVAWIFTLTFCYVLVLYARAGKEINWPLCALGVVVVLAVPLQALFKTIQTWAMTPSGKKLVEAALTKGVTMVTGATPTVTTTSTTEVGTKADL